MVFVILNYEIQGYFFLPRSILISIYNRINKRKIRGVVLNDVRFDC